MLQALLLSLTLATGQTPVFQAGAFAQDITPRKFPISVNGGMADRMVASANDRLHARCLVLDDGKTAIALVVCDSCMIPREIIDGAKKRVQDKIGIPANRILVSATHTHSAPTVTGVFQSDPDEEYCKQLEEQIAQGIIEAAKRKAPAQVGWGVASEPNQVFNRRWKMKEGGILANPFGHFDKVRMNPGVANPLLDKPAGPTDPDITILSVRKLDGKPIALFANYSLHYVGGNPNLSADYFGAFAERIKTLVGGDDAFVGAMFNGTSGDINNVNFPGPPRPKQGQGEQIRVVADAVAQASLKSYQKIEHKNHVPLATAQTEVELGVRLPNRDDLARAKQILAQAKDRQMLKGQPEIYARETELLALYPPTVKSVLQAIRIGDLGMLAIPCETFVEIGLELKKRSPFKTTCTVSLANGYNGYLPTVDQHALGGYETWRARSSYLEVDAAPKIVEALTKLMKGLVR